MTRASPGPTTTESLIPSNAHRRDVVTAAVSTTPKEYLKGPADGCEGVQAEAQAGGFVAEWATCLVERCDAQVRVPEMWRGDGRMDAVSST